MQFMVKKGRVFTPHADYCLPGITRATVSCTSPRGLWYLTLSIDKNNKKNK